MPRMQNLTIKHKLILIIMLTCIAALLLTGTAFIVWEWGSLRQTIVRNLSTQAAMIADNCKAALAFKDAEDAKGTLRALHVESSIVYGGVYTSSGEFFAGYYSDDADSSVRPPELKKTGYCFDGNYLTVYQPIVLDGETIGTVCLRSDLRSMSLMLKRNAVIVITFIFIVSLIAYLVSLRLQRIISGPILSLADVTKTVSEERDYSTRALKYSNDEVGLLIDAFNEMLEQIQQRDIELVDAKEKLEVRVEERTAELTCANEQLTQEITVRKKAEEELTQLLSLHTATLEATADGILVVDFKGRVVSNNQKFLQLWGIPEGLAESQNDEELLAFVLDQLKEPDAFIAEVRRLYSHPEEQSLGLLEFKDGRVFERFSNPHKVGDRIVGRVWSFRDVTEHKKAEAELRKAEERYRTQFEGALDAIFVADAETGIIIDCNPAATKLVGREKSELIGQHQKILHPSDKIEGGFNKTSKQRLGVEKGKTLESKVITKKGEIKDVAITASLLEVEGKKVMQGIFRDITERKKAELRQAQLLDQLEKTNQELKDFAYIVSHDLKAPLRGIHTLANWISADYSDKFDDDGKEQLALLSRRVDRMHNLIDGILQYSRVGRVREELTQVNLNELVPTIIDMVAPPENVTITVENELPVIEFEETRIIQVFQNLISNAVKYMDKPEGKIKISCTEENGLWKFCIADNGPGIEEKYFERIFQMFQTLSPRDEFESTGVGLTLVKKIVELYNGRVWLESKVGEGTSFFFVIPKQKTGVKDSMLEANVT